MENALSHQRMGLNRNQIKYIVIFAMLIDHLAWGFVDLRNPLLGQLMHFVGRLTGPTMAYFAAEGYRYTRDVGRYQKRLALFALLSWIPFVWFENGTLPFFFQGGSLVFVPVQGVIYTLFLGITAIRLWESKVSDGWKTAGIVGLCLLSMIGDWPLMDVLGCLCVHIYRDNPQKKWRSFTLIFFVPCMLIAIGSGFAQNWFQVGVLLVPLMLYYLYNGEGGSKAAVHKWFFYLFYPLHLTILAFLEWGLPW